MDAEHRARLARGRAHPFAARGGRARILSLPSLHDLRPHRRCRRRPDRQPQARDHDAERLDDLLRDSRAARPHRLTNAVARLRTRNPLRYGPRLRCPRPPGAHVPDGGTRGASERGRPEREPLQRLACRRSRGRRRADRRGRRRGLLPDQHDHVPCGSGRPPADAEGGAGTAPAERRAPDDDARHPRRLLLGPRPAADAPRAPDRHRRQHRRLQLPRPPAIARLATR